MRKGGHRALDKYSLQLSGWLKAETIKPRKQRRNLKQIHEDLKELGYGGPYDRVAVFARQWMMGQIRQGQFGEQTNKQPTDPKKQAELLVSFPISQASLEPSEADSRPGCPSENGWV